MASRLMKIRPDAKILVVDLAYIGDLLMSTPAYSNLRKGFPEARIDLLVAPGSLPVVERNPDIDHVRSTGIKSGGWNAIKKEARFLADQKYDLAICFHRGHGSLLMLSLARIPLRIGFTHGGRWLFLTTGIPFQITKHRAWNHLHLLEKCLPIEIDDKLPTRLDLDPEAVESVDQRLKDSGVENEMVAINPNSGWETKRWTSGGFASVADGVNQLGYLPVLIGSAGEKEISEGVASHIKGKALDLTGETTLPELAALLSRCRLVITNDSGPMHMANALGIPVVSIFGPTDPARCGPWMGGIVPIQSDLDCIKCYQKSCWHLKCMKEIDPDEVLKSATQCLSI
jgi:lipopolysaccharide heptosyltransferase II